MEEVALLRPGEREAFHGEGTVAAVGAPGRTGRMQGNEDAWKFLLPGKSRA